MATLRTAELDAGTTWQRLSNGRRSLLAMILGVSVAVASLAAVGLVLSPPACTFAPNLATMTTTLTADCTTDATITIADGWTLDGGGHTITAVDPSGGHFLGAVVMNGGTTAHVRNLRITTSGLADVCDGGADRLRGILFDGASGTIADNIVVDINQGASGCQEGNAIEVRNAPFDGTHPNPASVTIADNAVVDYQKTGILANGDVAVLVTGNVVVGVGPVPYIAQNGIQLGFGATGEVRGNEISGNYYTGCSNRQAAQTGCIPWVSGGLLLFDVDADAVKHSMNAYRGNQRNVLLVTSASLGSP